MPENIICGICGAEINPETRKTMYSEDSNAFKIQAVKKENEELKQKISDLENSLKKTQELLNPKENIKNVEKDDPDDW